jgi:heptosyltransferase I
VIVDLTGRLGLDASIAAIESGALLIGVDTGLTHAGSAFGLPTVALFGSTRPYVDAGASRTAVLFEEMACAPCRRHPTCGGAFHCMRALTVERVFDEAMRRLAA